MNGRIRRAVLGRVVARSALRPAHIYGFVRLYVQGRPYPMLKARSKSWVNGMLIHGLSPQDWRRLDDYEGDEYDRATVKVRMPGGQHRTALAYLCPAHVKASARRYRV